MSKYFCCFGIFENEEPENWRRKWKLAHRPSLRGKFVHTYHVSIDTKYIIQRNEILGMGSYGIVLKGREKKSNIDYAVKLFRLPASDRSRIDRELHLLKDVDHTNVVRLFAVYDTAVEIALVMELCSGGHLGNLLSKQSTHCIEEAWARTLIRQLLSAVAHLHSRGICHRLEKSCVHISIYIQYLFKASS